MVIIMIFLVLSILMYLVQNFSNKQFSQRNKNSSSDIALVQNGLCTLVSAITLAVCGGVRVLPPYEMLLAVLFGGLYLSVVFLLLKAFTCGSMGASTLLCNIGPFVSISYGIIRFGDEFTSFIAIGAVCLLGAVILATPKGDNDKEGGMKWFLLALSSGLVNGVTASAKREIVAVTDDVRNFLVWGFLFAALIAFGILVFKKSGRNSVKNVFGKPSLLLCGVGAGVGTAGANLFQMEAIFVGVSSAIVYPVTAGFLVASLWLMSLFVYKETTVRWQNILSVILCITAIVFINL